MFRFLRFASCLLGLSSLAAWPAAAQDSTLTRLIGRNQYPLQVSGQQFSGAGWDNIRADVQKSQFVLVGEDHGTAQIPQFAAALAQVLKPAVYVAEIDPYVTQALTELTTQPGPPAAYLRQYPGALCFYAFAEEFELVRQLRTQQTRLVGLDQVWSFSAAPFYTRLAGQVKNKATRAYLQQRAAAYQAQDQANEQRNGHTLAMTAQAPSAGDSLLALTKNESPAVQQMAQDYVASYRIYTERGTHQRRLNLMKHNLLQAVQPYQTAAGLATPPMLFKFGGLHLARGSSPIGYGEFYDVGNLVQNLADGQGQKSLHILILGKRGSKAISLNPRFPDKVAVTYTEADYDDDIPIKRFTDQVSGPAWSAFDLRPLRRALAEDKLQLPSRKLERVITGYDYLIVIPETTASHPM